MLAKTALASPNRSVAACGPENVPDGLEKTTGRPGMRLQNASRACAVTRVPGVPAAMLLGCNVRLEAMADNGPGTNKVFPVNENAPTVATTCTGPATVVATRTLAPPAPSVTAEVGSTAALGSTAEKVICRLAAGCSAASRSNSAK